MSKIPIKITRRRRIITDPVFIPSWLDDPESMGPCPCGMPPDDDCMVIEGDVLSRWFHPDCLDFLEKEMDEEEIEEKHEWERQMRKLAEGGNDE